MHNRSAIVRIDSFLIVNVKNLTEDSHTQVIRLMSSSRTWQLSVFHRTSNHIELAQIIQVKSSKFYYRRLNKPLKTFDQHITTNRAVKNIISNFRVHTRREWKQIDDDKSIPPCTRTVCDNEK